MTMANTFEHIRKLYNNTCEDIVRSPTVWQNFLGSACYNFRLPFDEQLLIYAQRPDAKAVLSFNSWNNRFNRMVNRGAKGIAVVDDSTDNPRLKYYFDISDTSERENSKPVPIWKYQDSFKDDVIKTLQNAYDIASDDIYNAVWETSKTLVEDNINDYNVDLVMCKNDSFLEELSEDMCESVLRMALQNSVAYMIMARLNLDVDGYFDNESFEGVMSFNTPLTVSILGNATSSIAEMGLSEISKTVLSVIRTFDKEQNTQYTKGEKENERSVTNDSNLYTNGQLPNTELNASADQNSSQQLWQGTQEIPQGNPSGNLSLSTDTGHTQQPLERDSGTGTADGRTNHNSDGKSTGSDRETQTNEYDDLGGNDEQYQELGEGNSIERTDLHDVTDELPPFVDEQAIRYMLSNPDDDLVQRKPAIIKAYQTTKKDNELINYTKTLYPRRFDEYDKFNKHFGFTLADNGLLMYEGNYKTRTKESVFSWDIVIGIIKELINDGKYLDTEKEEKTQLDLFSFSYDNEPVYDEAPQTSLFTDFGISQQIIDEALCCGFNDKNSRVQIAMHFRRDRGVEYNARMLKFLYGTNGAGFVFNGEKVSFWYQNI